jgi:hypothetical protein
VKLAPLVCLFAVTCDRRQEEPAPPPPADCKAVGDVLAAFDVGNYATVEQRAPVAATYRADCERQHVTQAEGACLDKATDKWSAAQCVPRLFPDLASSNSSDCAEIVKKTKSTLEKQAAYVNDPAMKGWFERTMAVMQQSCEDDHWPDALKKCMLGPNAAACNAQMPAALQKKLQDRMVAAMKEFQAAQNH